jgi:hypothetical protein
MLGTPFIAAVRVDAEPVLAAAALTCIITTTQYPFGSAHAGTGYRAARASTGLVFVSSAVSASVLVAAAAESMAVRESMIPFPGPCFHASYRCLQTAGEAVCVTVGEGLVADADDPVADAEGMVADAEGAAVWVHAVSPAIAAPAATKVRRFICRTLRHRRTSSPYRASVLLT